MYKVGKRNINPKTNLKNKVTRAETSTLSRVASPIYSLE